MKLMWKPSRDYRPSNGSYRYCFEQVKSECTGEHEGRLRIGFGDCMRVGHDLAYMGCGHHHVRDYGL
jgi:hypothetical protein